MKYLLLYLEPRDIIITYIIENKQTRLIDVRKIILDSKISHKEINYVPKVTLNEGIQKTWYWIISSF